MNRFRAIDCGGVVASMEFRYGAVGPLEPLVDAARWDTLGVAGIALRPDGTASDVADLCCALLEHLRQRQSAPECVGRSLAVVLVTDPEPAARPMMLAAEHAVRGIVQALTRELPASAGRLNLVVTAAHRLGGVLAALAFLSEPGSGFVAGATLRAGLPAVTP